MEAAKPASGGQALRDCIPRRSLVLLPLRRRMSMLSYPAVSLGGSYGARVFGERAAGDRVGPGRYVRWPDGFDFRQPHRISERF